MFAVFHHHCLLILCASIHLINSDSGMRYDFPTRMAGKSSSRINLKTVRTLMPSLCATWLVDKNFSVMVYSSPLWINPGQTTSVDQSQSRSSSNGHKSFLSRLHDVHGNSSEKDIRLIRPPFDNLIVSPLPRLFHAVDRFKKLLCLFPVLKELNIPFCR